MDKEEVGCFLGTNAIILLILLGVGGIGLLAGNVLGEDAEKGWYILLALIVVVVFIVIGRSSKKDKES